MTDLARWLRARRPPPPEDLLRRILTTVSGDGSPGGTGSVQLLLESGRRALLRARQGTGRDRSTAFELLVADALITYSCEAALQAEDAESELLRLLTVVEEI